jgi:hypothetical protein
VYEVDILPDAYGCGSAETDLRTWFYFSVTGAAAGETLVLEVPRASNQSALFSHDYRPVVRAPPARPAWERLRYPVTFAVCGSPGFAPVAA